jgi:hypothetical protein
MGHTNYKQWRDAIEKMTPEDILTGHFPGDTPVYAKILLEKLRVKFSGLTVEQLAACRRAIERYRQEVDDHERKSIQLNTEDRIKRYKLAADDGVKRAEEEAFGKRLRELGIPDFVVPDGADAPALLLRIANMSKRERMKYIESAMDSHQCSKCDGTTDCCDCTYEGMESISLCLSEWKWIQKAANRCMDDVELKVNG